MIDDITRIGAEAPGRIAAASTLDELRAVVPGASVRVVVNRLGSTPLDQATVVAVRHGQNYSRTDSLSPVTQRTVYVDVK